jgi:hypothetical protein
MHAYSERADMATLNDKVRDVLGSQVLEILQLQVRVETLEARVKELETPKPAPEQP